MKATRFFPAVLILIALLLGACNAAPATSAAAPGNGISDDQPQVSELTFTGVIEGIAEGQWVVSGQTVSVDPSSIQGGPFLAGDTVKIEAVVEADGSLTARRIEAPSASDLAEAATVPLPAGSPSASLIFDDSGTEAFGTVEAITATSITIGGQTFPFTPGAEIKGAIATGVFVKLHFIVNPDGSLSVREVELFDPSQIGNVNGSDDNSNTNTNDDNSNDDNGNDDNSNDDNGNDDNSNDDNGNDDNSNNDNDDDDDGDNSNDDNDND